MVVTGLAVAAAAWGVLMIGFVLWMSYGIAAHNLALIVPNAIALLIGGGTIAVAVQLSRKTGTER